MSEMELAERVSHAEARPSGDAVLSLRGVTKRFATGSQPAPGPLARLGRLVGSLAARAAGAVRRPAAAGPSCCPA